MSQLDDQIESRARKSLHPKLTGFMKSLNPKKAVRRNIHLIPHTLNVNLATHRVGNISKKQYFKLEPNKKHNPESKVTQKLLKAVE